MKSGSDVPGYIMTTRILIVLASYMVLWISVDGKNWQCGVDICTEGVHFCHANRRICFKCEDFETTCFSRLHEPNCSLWCEGNFKKKVEQTVIENSCGPLSLLPNGHVNGTNSTLHSSGDVVYFTCNPGFDRVGPESITCIGFGEWSPPPPVCQGGNANSKDNYSAIFLVLGIVGYVLWIFTSVYSVHLKRKCKKQEKKLSAAEEMPLLNVSEADSINKTEPTSIKVDNPSVRPESTGTGEATRKKEVSSAPHRPSAPKIPSAPPANIDGTETPETNPKVPVGSNSESPQRSTRAIQETGIKPDHSTERPLPPRQIEAFHPVDDDSGEKGLSPDLPSAAAGLSRQLSDH